MKLFVNFIFISCFFSVVFSADDPRKIMAEFQKEYYKPKLSSEKKIELINTLKDVEGKYACPLLLNAFDEDDPRVLSAMQAVVESYSQDETMAKWILKNGIVKVKNPFGRSYLISALAKYDFESTNEMLLKYLSSTKDGELLVPVVEVLGALGKESSLQGLIDARKNPLYWEHYGFRKTLFDALIQFPHKDVVEFFIKSLQENEGFIEIQIHEYLNLVTGKRTFGYDNWKKIWDEEKDKITLKKITPEEVNARVMAIKPEGEVASYYDIPLLAKRLVFVIDNSGSMDWKDESSESNETRMDRAKIELANAISKLPEDVLMEVVGFSTNIGPWFSQLVNLTKAAQKKIAIRIKGMNAVGGTNTHGAFKRALNFNDNVEAIYLLSDGAPSMGEIVENEPLLDQIYRWNRFKKVQINSIGLVFGDVPEKYRKRGVSENKTKLKEFLEKLATQNNGQFKFIEK